MRVKGRLGNWHARQGWPSRCLSGDAKQKLAILRYGSVIEAEFSGRNAPPQVIGSVLDRPLKQAVLGLEGWHSSNSSDVIGNLRDAFTRKVDAEPIGTCWGPKDPGAA